MPAFQYKEVDKKGKVFTGNMIAETKNEIISSIRNKGNKVIEIREIEEKSKDINTLEIFKPKVKAKDIYVFCKQMHTMLGAGMPLLSSLAVLENQTENKTLKAIFLDMQLDLQKGSVFSQTMKKHKQFPSLLVNMVEAGEMTGNLDQVLEKMAVHFEKEMKINKKIKAALIYPIILALLSIGVIIFILTGLMPMFVGMFKDSGVELPMITQVLVSMSDFMVAYWYIIVLVVVTLAFFTNRFLSTTDGKKKWDQMVMGLPIVKKPIQMIYTSRFTRTLSTLLGSGISILDAFQTAAKITNNRVVIDSIDDAANSMKRGEAISVTLERYNLFPPMMISMLSIGEESGSVEMMLGKTADYYDEELDDAIGTLIGLLEPVLIIIMGGFVGLSVIAIMLPMFNMATAIS